MDKDSNKPADQRGGTDRRHDDDPDFPGPGRRGIDRRKDKRPSKYPPRQPSVRPPVARRSVRLYPAAMLKLIIGNKAYSSWSLRGWLACKQSGLPFEEAVVPLYDDDWDKRRQGDEFAPSSGKVPILWDGDIVVWDSLAIIEFLNDRYGSALYWPEEEGARGMARSMAAEMHSGFANLRRELPMNVRKSFPAAKLNSAVREEIDRILQLWAQ